MQPLSLRVEGGEEEKNSCMRTGQSEVGQEVLLDLKMVQIYFSRVQKCLK